MQGGSHDDSAIYTRRSGRPASRNCTATLDDTSIQYCSRWERGTIDKHPVLASLQKMKAYGLRRAKPKLAKELFICLEREYPDNMDYKRELAELYFDNEQMEDAALIYMILFIKTGRQLFLYYLVVSSLYTDYFELFFLHFNILKYSEQDTLGTASPNECRSEAAENHPLDSAGSLVPSSMATSAPTAASAPVAGGASEQAESCAACYGGSFMARSIKKLLGRRRSSHCLEHVAARYEQAAEHDKQNRQSKTGADRECSAGDNEQFNRSYEESISLIKNGQISQALKHLQLLYGQETLLSLVCFIEQRDNIEMVYELQQRHPFFRILFGTMSSHFTAAKRHALFVILRTQNQEAFDEFLPIV